MQFLKLIVIVLAENDQGLILPIGEWSLFQEHLNCNFSRYII